jgi:hypothetical protein
VTNVVFAIVVVSNKKETILIGIDNNGTRIITDSEDPIFKTEIITFIRTFMNYFYNFDQDTYPENLGRASDLMSIELWKAKKDTIVKLGDQIKKDPKQLAAHITKIVKEDDFYIVSLNVEELYRAKKTNFLVQLKVSVNKIDRTATNPYGLEISTLEEIKE